MVRAKFECVEKNNESGTVKLEVVTGGSKENDNFFKCTPSGQLTMGTINEEAFKQFVEGKEYYIDFTPVE